MTLSIAAALPASPPSAPFACRRHRPCAPRAPLCSSVVVFSGTNRFARPASAHLAPACPHPVDRGRPRRPRIAQPRQRHCLQPWCCSPPRLAAPPARLRSPLLFHHDGTAHRVMRHTAQFFAQNFETAGNGWRQPKKSTVPGTRSILTRNWATVKLCNTSLERSSSLTGLSTGRCTSGL